MIMVPTTGWPTIQEEHKNVVSHVLNLMKRSINTERTENIAILKNNCVKSMIDILSLDQETMKYIYIPSGISGDK